MSIEQKLCEVKIFQLQSMSNAIRCIDQRFAFKNSRISCLALIFKMKNPSTTVLYAKRSVPGGEIRQFIYRFFHTIDTNLRLVVKVIRRKSVDMGSILAKTPPAAPRPFCVALRPLSALEVFQSLDKTKHSLDNPKHDRQFKRVGQAFMLQGQPLWFFFLQAAWARFSSSLTQEDTLRLTTMCPLLFFD